MIRILREYLTRLSVNSCLVVLILLIVLTLVQSAPYTSNRYGSIVNKKTKRHTMDTSSYTRDSRLKLTSANIYHVLNFLDKLPRKDHVTEKRTFFDKFEDTATPISSEYGKSTRKRPEEVHCPTAEDGIKQFACATPNEFDEYRCIDDHMLCDHEQHCPNGEDEDPTVCMFHRMTMNYFKVLLDAVLGLTHSIV